MNPADHIIGEAVRVEFDEQTGELFVVFKIVDEKYKQTLRKNWTSNDIEFKLIDKALIK